MLWLHPCCIAAQLLLLCSAQDNTEGDRAAKAEKALDYVERVRTSECSGGIEETLPVQFDHSKWRQYADVALRMSNLVTKLLVRGNSTLNKIEDAFLYDLVRNNVDDNSLIFGSAVGMDAYVHPEYRLFGPYAYRAVEDRAHSHDLAVNYDYLTPEAEWFMVLRGRNWENVSQSTSVVWYRTGESEHTDVQRLVQPLASLEDGHWTHPYYDCGGGYIWMVTYSAPILAFNHSTGNPMFMGIGTIDIELTNIDINQCDENSAEEDPEDPEAMAASVDVFRGTHNCLPSTKCVPVRGRGFIRGAYLCQCLPGFYFPDLDAEVKAFNGSELEELMGQNNGSLSAKQTEQFTCLRCAEGCDTCVDASPCLYAYRLIVRVVLLGLTIALLMVVVLISCLVAAFRNRRPIKSASPMFLHLMTAGAGLMCVPMMVMFVDPNKVTCTLRLWPRHIGFALTYGALLLKTWRITAIFRVKSARRVNLSDKVLAQRFLPILCVTCVYLAAWSALGRPGLTWRRTNSDLKFVDCTSDWWEYGAVAGEACFLLWGAYLCYVVRKAPSHFNESKYITWSIYNNIILGTFIIIIKKFIAIQAGPDTMYLLDFVYLQVTATITLGLIFLPKFYALTSSGDEEEASSGTMTVTGRQKNAATTDVWTQGLTDAATQTEASFVDPQVATASREPTLKRNQVAPL